MDKLRCDWCLGDPIYIDYHDQEWGIPIHTDQQLFEFLVLEGAQAGLSWITILKKRSAYRVAFDQFDVTKVAQYSEFQVQALLNNAGIVRNKLKIRSTVKNAQSFIKVCEEFGSFNNYIWQFTDGKTIHNTWSCTDELPAETPLSHIISKDLKQRGFRFVGATICYAYMQAIGIVNDHIVSCFRYDELKES